MSDAIVVTDETGATTANHALSAAEPPEWCWKGLPLWAVLVSRRAFRWSLRTETEPVSAFEISRPNTHPPL